MIQHRDLADENDATLPAHLCGLDVYEDWPTYPPVEVRGRRLIDERLLIEARQERDIARRWAVRWKRAAKHKRKGIALILDHVIAKSVAAMARRQGERL